MPLDDLTVHVDEQEKAIRELPKGTSFEDGPYTTWKRIRASLWGAGLHISERTQHVVERDNTIPVGAVTLPKEHTVATFPEGLFSKISNILVRSEYFEAEREAVLSSESLNMFVVSGQPGVGLFLSFSTARRI